jgi:hypothetical protein
MGVVTRLAHAWNTFLDQDQNRMLDTMPFSEQGAGYSTRPGSVRTFINNEKSIISAIYLRLAIDAATVDIRHVKLDEQGRYQEDVNSGLHNCLNVEANIDQSGRAFMQDVFMTMFDVGHAAIVPIDMSTSPMNGGLFDVQTVRVGRVVQYYPSHVRVDVLNDITGRHEEVTIHKRHVGIVENPLATVMNDQNSTLRRLIRKLALLDMVDEQNSSGKLDMLIQLPFPIRSEGRRRDAAQRYADIQFQLRNSEHGIAYIDASEKVTQLNRPVENKMLEQVLSLREQVYTELGLTPGVMNGTATEAEMLNYNARTTEPVIDAVRSELHRKFLTKTARTQGHAYMFFRDPFKLVPMSVLAELADKFTRNEIVTSNEFRGFIGMRPSKDQQQLDRPANPASWWHHGGGRSSVQRGGHRTRGSVRRDQRNP